MADRPKDVGNRLEALERSLRLPQKRELAAAGKEAADLRQRALQFDDRPEVTALATRIAALADRGDVVIEWTARDVDPAISAAVSCCCCCCCCCSSAALEAGGGVRA
jgi:streptolysin S family bacteriocin protoxin